ncbi:MAG: methylated-DNA--[protein]-cysteine S-methyltransferase, partial [Reyranella sp.]
MTDPTDALGFALFETPIGACGIAWGPRGILGLQLPESTTNGTRKRMGRRWTGATETEPPAGVQHAIDRVLALLAGEAVDLGDIPLDLEAAPDFHRKVYEVARTIPPGQTMTYGEIAKRIGAQPQEAREVGAALGKNPFAIIVPCHRVLAANGKLGGFSATGGVDTKRRILEIEGASAVSAGPLFAGLK